MKYIKLKIFSKMNLRELEVLPGFMIGGNNTNSKIYTDDAVFIAETERKI